MRGPPNFHGQSLRFVSEKIGSPAPRKRRQPGSVRCAPGFPVNVPDPSVRGFSK
jgi:hypothetical protein